MFLILTAFFFKLVDIIHYLSSRFKGIKRAIASRKDVLHRDLRPLTDSLDLNDLVLGSAESDFGSGDDFKPFDGQAFVDKGRLNIHRRQLDDLALLGDERDLLAVGLAQSFMGEYSNDYGALMAFSVAGSLPIVLLFIFFQKYMVEGLTAGAVKG